MAQNQPYNLEHLKYYFHSIFSYIFNYMLICAVSPWLYLVIQASVTDILALLCSVKPAAAGFPFALALEV
jgi:hypothetical protein